MDVPPAWATAAGRIRRERWRTVMVIGATDVGKSAFCRYLAQALLDDGRDVAFLDADIGQADLGPPAAITLGHAGQGGAAAVEFFFVGSTDPARHILPVVSGTARLVRRAQPACTVINTAGLVQGPGRRLKSHKIDAVAPDGLIAISRADELGSLLRAYRHVPQIRLPPSPAARRKSGAERRANRRTAFRRYFEGACDVECGADALAFQRTGLFSGQPFAAAGAVHAERLTDGTVVTVGEPDTPPARISERLPAGFETSLLCGVADAQGRGLGLAAIRAIDFRARRITLWTPVPRERIAVVQLGAMRLDF